MNLDDIASIYVFAYGVIAALVVVGVAWLAWAWRADRREDHGR